VTARDDLVLLYDGTCGFCDGTVRFILARDRRREMRFAPLQGPFARDVLARHRELAGVDSLVLVSGPGSPAERVRVRSEAAIEIARYLGGGWRAAVVLRPIPRFLRDAAYDLFASVRYRLFGRLDACPVPSAEVRARFLD
jgi:predicted DCC family thiol-disulfide oxidoreductase YuxK